MLDCNAVWVQFFSIKIKSRTVTYTKLNIIITQHHTLNLAHSTLYSDMPSFAGLFLLLCQLLHKVQPSRQDQDYE